MIGVVVLMHLFSWHLNGVFGAEVKSLSVMEGDSVTLHTDITQIQRDDVIEWMFGVESPDEIIAEYNREANTTSFNDERFKNHLYLNHQTGDLIITNITNKHTGLYKVEITKKTVLFKHFSVTVYARLPVPVISSNSSYCSSSSSRCALLCSVLNVRDVSLSWYKGNSLLSIISVSDLNIRLSLHLEVEYQDTNTYRCVLNNTITNQTQHLNIKNLCQTCSGLSITEKCLICGAVGSLMIVAAVLMFWMYRKHTKTQQEVQSSEEITYMDPTFFKGKKTKSRAPVEDDVVYAGVMTQ